MDAIRVDKFVWAVRFYKTRSIGAEAVKAGHVLLNEKPVKPAQNVFVGDMVMIKRNPIWRSYKVLQLLKNRVGAKLVCQYLEECTPESELTKLELMKLMPGYDRERGSGRPTKKERRELDDFDPW